MSSKIVLKQVYPPKFSDAELKAVAVLAQRAGRRSPQLAQYLISIVEKEFARREADEVQETTLPTCDFEKWNDHEMNDALMASVDLMAYVRHIDGPVWELVYSLTVAISCWCGTRVVVYGSHLSDKIQSRRVGADDDNDDPVTDVLYVHDDGAP